MSELVRYGGEVLTLNEAIDRINRQLVMMQLLGAALQKYVVRAMSQQSSQLQSGLTEDPVIPGGTDAALQISNDDINGDTRVPYDLASTGAPGTAYDEPFTNTEHTVFSLRFANTTDVPGFYGRAGYIVGSNKILTNGSLSIWLYPQGATFTGDEDAIQQYQPGRYNVYQQLNGTSVAIGYADVNSTVAFGLGGVATKVTSQMDVTFTLDVSVYIINSLSGAQLAVYALGSDVNVTATQARLNRITAPFGISVQTITDELREAAQGMLRVGRDAAQRFAEGFRTADSPLDLIGLAFGSTMEAIQAEPNASKSQKNVAAALEMIVENGLAIGEFVLEAIEIAEGVPI
jgi:hypothetical protein